MTDTSRWTASETAARLGVKPETLYAYVSRGLLTRTRTGAGSTFDPVEVERFAATRRRAVADRPAVVIRDGRPSGGPLMTIDTDVALIEDDDLYYRGRSATGLARSTRFESVCHWLWTGDVDDRIRFSPLSEAVAAVRRVLAAMPGSAQLSDRVQVMVPVVAGLDPLREVLTTESIAVRIGALLATLAAGLEPDPAKIEARPAGSGDRSRGRGDQPGAPDDQWPGGQPGGVDDRPAAPDRRADIAGRLATALAGPDHDPQLIDCLNAALVLLVDHDLAASTMAARTAASARANPYAVILSGLGALDSALHGNASRSAYRMLAAVQAGEDARSVIARTLATGRTGVPGFGHRIYRTADPRAEVIFDLIVALDGAGPALDAAAAITAIVADHGAMFRNVDLGLATLALAAGMAADAGEVIFGIARIGGWIAHAIDEYQQTPLRLRPVGRYVGP
ncbi:MAG: hypothetical protein J2P23_02645 [Microlunatus sp.]|nr:hypothetical protein [Microlunatus sp.]